MVSLVSFLLLACGASTAPTESTARADFQRLRPAFEDIRRQVELSLDAVSSYEPIDCTDVVEGMREMCFARSAAQEQASEDQRMAFRQNVAAITARDDVIALRCFDGDTLMGGPTSPPSGAAAETVLVEELQLGWGIFGEREGIHLSWTVDTRRCQLYMGT